MASDALGPVAQMQLAGRCRHIVPDGDVMRYRKARIRYYRLETETDPADYPDD